MKADGNESVATVASTEGASGVTEAAGGQSAALPPSPSPAVQRDAVEWYRSLTRAITDYTYTVILQDGAPVQTLHSRTSEAVIGYTQEDFDADPYLWITMVPPEEHAAVKEQAAALLAGRHPDPLEHRLLRKDGATIWVESHLVPRYGGDGSLTEYTGVVKDITRRKRAEQRRASDDAARALGDVAASVAHEVRNPLNGILVPLELLQEQFTREPDRELCLEQLNRIGRQAGRLKVLMDDLLKLRQPVTLEDVKAVALDDLCRKGFDAWKNSEPLAHNIAFDVASDAKGLAVKADSYRLTQALTNLLNNAAEHTPSRGNIAFRIDIAPSGEARIRIVDEGEGIPPENADKVFRPFYTSRREGTGLGLSLVKRIVEQHDGTVTVHNNGDGPGCTAEVLLPPTRG